LASQGRFDDAISQFGKALELSPDHVGAEANLGGALLAQGQVEAAIPHLRKALAAGPETAQLHDNLGIALAETAQMPAAIEQFERALQLAPELVDAHYSLGMALVMGGQEAKGLEHWRKALAHEPNNVQVLNDTAWLLATSSNASLRNAAEAVTLAQRAVQRTSGHDPAMLGTLAAAYAAEGRYDKAIPTERSATDLAAQQGNEPLAVQLRSRLTSMEAKTPILQP
jgi:tetratricopeptide (TPR) repeat protein